MQQELLYISCKLSKKENKKIVTGYMNEGFEFWRHLFAKSVRYIYYITYNVFITIRMEVAVTQSNTL